MGCIFGWGRFDSACLLGFEGWLAGFGGGRGVMKAGGRTMVEGILLGFGSWGCGEVLEGGLTGEEGGKDRVGLAA